MIYIFDLFNVELKHIFTKQPEYRIFLDFYVSSFPSNFTTVADTSNSTVIVLEKHHQNFLN